MCGISGIFSKRNCLKDQITRLVSRLQHRGPDGNGIYTDPQNFLALGHTRLAILDPNSASDQPMLSPCKNYILVFNGEIYNFKELKAEMIQEGIHFSRESDTEVLLHACIHYKENALKKIRGMFAFAFYDKSANTLLLARDEMGIKPLYFCLNDEDFSFASETTALVSCGLSKKTINQRSLRLYQLLGFIPEPATIFEEIQTLKAGHYIQFYLKKPDFTQKKFSSSPVYTYSSRQEMIAAIRTAIFSASKSHLQSDVPIGCFASGGTDSSCIVAAASASTKLLETVSLIFPESEFSEEFYIDAVAKQYKNKVKKQILNESLWKAALEAFIQNMDQPTFDGLNTWLISRFAKQCGLKVVLSGLGGDELFYGYPSFRRFQKLKLLCGLGNFLPLLSKIKGFEKLDLLQKPSLFRIWLVSRALYGINQASFFIQISPQTLEEDLDWLESSLQIPQNLSETDRIGWFETNLYMKDLLLRDSDVFSMAHSVELRVPLLDQEVVQTAKAIPSKEKLKGHFNKSILVEAFMELPECIYNRTKRGFELPFSVWIKKNIHELKIKNIRIQDAFINDKIHWSRYWSQFILEKWLEKISHLPS